MNRWMERGGGIGIRGSVMDWDGVVGYIVILPNSSFQ